MQRRAPAPSRRFVEDSEARRIEGREGLALLARRPPDVIIIEMSGRVDADQAKRVITTLSELLRAGDGSHIFANLAELEDYHSNLRTGAVELLTQQRARVRTIHAYSKSRIVGMGVAVVSLALGGIIQHHQHAAAFESALEKHLRGS
jgi:hypothetical protein